MQRNYPRMFLTTDDQDKDGFKLENVGPGDVFKFRCRNALKIGCTTDFGSTYRLRITMNIFLN